MSEENLLHLTTMLTQKNSQQNNMLLFANWLEEFKEINYKRKLILKLQIFSQTDKN